MNPHVTVVMPAYNAASTIGASLSSVLWQSYPEFDAVVVDDGSSDGTARIVSALGGPVTLVRQRNAGAPAARNRGIAEARGDLIALCDADDLLFEQYLETLVEAWRRGGGGIATANAWWLLPGGLHPGRTRHKGHFPRYRQQRMAILHQNFVSTMSIFPRRLVEEIGPFAEDLPRGDDWDFWMRAIFAGSRVTHQARPLALYRWGSTGLSSGRVEFHAADVEVLRRVDRRQDLTPRERAYVRRRLSGPAPRELASQADDALRRRRYHEAAHLYRQAAELCPTETMLVRKSRLMTLAPRVAGPALRARQVRIEKALGFDERHVR